MRGHLARKRMKEREEDMPKVAEPAGDLLISTEIPVRETKKAQPRVKARPSIVAPLNLQQTLPSTVAPVEVK